MIFSSDDLRRFQRAAVQAGIARDALLAGVDRVIVASLRAQANLGEQLLADLDALNRVRPLDETTPPPIEEWLKNAVALAGPRAERAIFQDALDQRGADRDLLRRDEGRGRFLAQVERVVRLRFPSATVARGHAPEPFEGLLEVTTRDGALSVVDLVGALDRDPTEDAIASFARGVHDVYQRDTPLLRSRLVHAGAATPEELAQSAFRKGFLLTSLREYQGLIDFGRYLRWQTARLEGDEVYPPSLYVTQPARVSVGGDRESEAADALGTLGELLGSPQARFVLVLGDFGAGKTFLLHELARRMAVEQHPVTPVLVEMRALEKQRSLDALIAQHLSMADMGPIDLKAFRYLLTEGRVALLFDGFDELALRLTYDRALEHFDTLVQAAEGNAKVVLTSRTQHFLNDGQVKLALAERAERIPGYRLVRLQPFEEPQIRRFLVNRLQDERAAEERLALLGEVRDLLGLSKNPRMLGFIANLDPRKLEDAKAEAGEISSAKLYDLLIEQWLDFEHKRVNPAGSPHGITRERLRAAMTDLALLVWGRVDRAVAMGDLPEALFAAVQVPNRPVLEAGVVAHQLGSGSLLVRDEAGAFSFLHQSVLEWLVAGEAARQLGAGVDPAALRVDVMSDLMADFFASLAGREAARGWAGKVLHGGEAGHAKDNALRVQRRLARRDGEEEIGEADIEVVAGPDLAGQDLRGRDLSGADLRRANLARADLRGAMLRGARLGGANLAGAVLARADLRNADLRGADLSGADLSFASLLGADLREVAWAGANLRAARLVGATTDEITPRGAALLVVAGAAPPRPAGIEPMIAPVSGCNSVAWSERGDLLATGHDDGSVRLWDAVTGQALRILWGHRDAVQSVAFSPGGDTLASGSYDKTVRLWEVGSGRALRTLEGHTNLVLSVAFNPGGDTLASGSYDTTVRLWEVGSGRALRTLEGHTNLVQSVAFSPGGDTLASGSHDTTVRLWEVGSGRALRTLEGHTHGVQSVAFSPGGDTLASGSSDTTVRLWEVGSGRALRTLEGHTNLVRSVAFSPGGDILASGSSDTTVRLWVVGSGRALRTLEGHTHGVLSVAFSPGGDTLASGSSDTTVRLWEVGSGRALRTLKGHTNGVLSVAFSPGGDTLASGSSDTTVRLWEVGSGRALRTLKGHTNLVRSVAFSPGGDTLASGSSDTTVRLWEVGSGRALRTLEGHTNGVRSVAFSPGGDTLASGSSDKTVRLWEVGSGRALRTLEGHTNLVLSVAFSPGGDTLASGSSDKTVRLWVVGSGRALRTLEGHTNLVLSVAFSPGGDTLASGSSDKTVRLWEVGSGRALRTLEGHTNGVQSVAFSPGGDTLASGSYDTTVRLWEVGSGRALRTLEGHTSAIECVAFHPNGHFLASVANDGIRLWKVATGENLAVLAHTKEGWVAFTPDGRYKLSGNLAGSFWHVVGLCRFEPGELDPYLPAYRRIPDDEPLFPYPST